LDKAKIISICPTYFLAEYFVEALQVLAALSIFYSCGWLKTFATIISTSLNNNSV